MGQQLGLYGQAGEFPSSERFAEMDGIPVIDDCGEQVEPGHAVVLALTRAVSDFALTPAAERILVSVRIWQPGNRRFWSLVSPTIASAPIMASPVSPVPGPASTRPSPPYAKGTPCGRAETRPPGQVRPGCARHRGPASGTGRETGPRPAP